MRQRPCLTLSLALLASVGCRPTVDVGREQEALLEADRAWAAVVEEGVDVDSIVSFWTDDARLVGEGQPVLHGRSAIREAVAGTMAAPGFRLTWVPDGVVVSRSGDLGYTFGANAVTVTDSTGALRTFRGRYITVWRKEGDGRWRTVMDYSNSGPPETPSGR